MIKYSISDEQIVFHYYFLMIGNFNMISIVIVYMNT